jgi:hypothetical protein
MLWHRHSWIRQAFDAGIPDEFTVGDMDVSKVSHEYTPQNTISSAPSTSHVVHALVLLG